MFRYRKGRNPVARAIKILGALFLLFLLSGCAGPPWETAGRIVPPENGNGPLAGKWVIEQELNSGQNSRAADQTWVGKTAQFSRDAAMVGEYTWPNPIFKVKKVNTEEYLLSKYLSLAGDLAIKSTEVYVVTMLTADNFLGEFMKIDDRTALALVQNKALYLKKTSDTVDSSLTTAVAAQDTLEPSKSGKPGTSGVLLGLKTPVKVDGQEQRTSNFTYRTLWLAASNKGLHPVLEGKDIFFPRQSGFWKLKVRRVEEGARAEDLLLAYDVSTKDPEEALALDSLYWLNRDGFLARSLSFVGNDFVSFEIDGGGAFSDSGQSWFDNSLQVNPMDNLATRQGIKLSDLAGDKGAQAFSNARSPVLRTLVKQDDVEVGAGGQEQNLGLVRKNGHWFFQGRISYRKSGRPGYLDFNINLVPPAKLVSFDTLYLSWQNIKDRVPDAVDAFTSPNRDLAIVATKARLYLYTINKGRLESEPLTKLDLNEGETVVMSEWATGFYVDNWEQSFRANGAKEVYN